MSTEHFPALIVVVPLLLSFVVFAVGLTRRRLCLPIVILALLACLVFAIGILQDVLTRGGTIRYFLGAWAPPWGIEYAVDHLNALILVAIAIVSLLVAIHSKSVVAKEIPASRLGPFYTLFLLQVTGLFGMTITGDVFNLYVLLEIASFSAYAIIGMGEGGAPFAAFRYMIFGTIGACAYLLGIGYLYILTGSLNMADLRQLLVPLYESRVLLVGFAFIMVGVAIKMALFPVHTWLPDSYTLAPSSVSALLAPLFTKVGVYVLLRFLFTVFDPSFSIQLFPVLKILGGIAVIGILFASIMALAQTDLKRMLCYLIVAEIGYIVIGVACANRLGLTGAILHTVNDIFMMACLFTAAGSISAYRGSRNIDLLRGLHRTMPVTLAVFVAGALSVVGVPPLCGFFSKWYLVLGTVHARQWVYLGVLLAGSLLNAVLFFRVLEKSYFELRDERGHTEPHGRRRLAVDRLARTELIPMVLLALILLFLGIFSNSIIRDIVAYAIPKTL